MPPVTNESQEIEAIRQFFEDRWSDCPVIFPNQSQDPPAAIDEGAVGFPARFVAIAITYDASPRITYGGTNEVRARLECSCWVQGGTSDERLRQMEKSLDDAIRQFGDGYGLQFTGLVVRSETVEPDEEFPFCGRATAHEYVWFREAA